MNTPLPTVMIVDDVPLIRKGIAQCLENKGVNIIATARNGQEAIELAEQHTPNIILLDIVMPIMQGYEALPVLREKLPNAIIIMLTSTSEHNLVLECRKQGANGFIIKSDEMQETLFDRLMSIWKKKITPLS